MSTESPKKDKKAAPVFVQTVVPDRSEFDQWKQMTEQEARAAYEMTLRNELSGGTAVVRAFEERWRTWIGSNYCLTTCNGTLALLSAFFGLGIGPGDEVICPTYTWICSVAPALLLGARPVFCESDPETLLIDPQDIRRRITDKTRLIIVVDLWGLVCDMGAIMAISEETGIPVVEDVSHAHGARYKGRMCGSIGAAGCWSLQGSKPVSAGEGGVMVTDDEECFERACLVGQVNRIKGVDLVTEKYSHLQPLGLGIKLRSHPLGIGIASVQLDRLDELNAKRRAYVEAVEEGIQDIPGLHPVRTYDGAERAGFYGFPILHDPEAMSGLSTQAFREAVCNEGITVNDGGYPLLHTLPLFADGFDVFTRGRGPLCGDYPGYKEGDFPVTEKMARQLVFLPVLSDPAPDAADQVVSTLDRAANRADELAST